MLENSYEFLRHRKGKGIALLESIKIQGFRKYSNFSIENFGRVNFILGNNNVGKSSVLEAIYAWACGQNIAPIMNIPLSRGRYSAVQYPYWMMEEILAMGAMFCPHAHA